MSYPYSSLPGKCTLNANSAHEAVFKMCTLPLFAGENIETAFVVPAVAARLPCRGASSRSAI